jgi:hypothetical protein
LCSIETDPLLLPSTQELTDKLWKPDPGDESLFPSPQCYDITVTKRWLTSVGYTTKVEEAPAPPASTIAALPISSRLSAPSSPDALELSFLKRSHLFLCSDLAKRLMYSSCPPLREEAANILR